MCAPRFTLLFSVTLVSAIAVAQSNPVPIIFKPLVPGAVTPGSAGFTLTVKGANFVQGAVVKWNGKRRSTKFLSSSKVRAIILASDIAAAGTASVTVQNPTPGHATSNVALFSVTNPTGSVSFSVTNTDVGMDDDFGVATGDWNSDGKPDLAVEGFIGSEPSEGKVRTYLGDGSGGIRLGQILTFDANGDGHRIGVGDLNGDGILDLAVEENGLTILKGLGDGAVQVAATLSSQIFSPQAAVLADFNKDGVLDIATTEQEFDNHVAVVLGQGKFKYGPTALYATAGVAADLAVGDFNRDGNLDLAVACSAANELAILFGNGDGTFQPAIFYATGKEDLSIDTADLNGDGILDLVTADFTSPSGNISVLLGKSDGTFRPHVEYATASLPIPVLLADMNGDGVLDLVSATEGVPEATISVNPGNGDGTFGAVISVPTTPDPNSLAVTDFNNDGRLDLTHTTDSIDVSIALQTSQ